MPKNIKDNLTIPLDLDSVSIEPPRAGRRGGSSVLDSNVITNTLQVVFGQDYRYIKLIKTGNYFEFFLSEKSYYVGGNYE